ncbi:response regulator transcription factor [Ralstonia solanacearum]|uniref:Response regulator protein n=1 Tax=Ralstonia solanacearum (strain Po82) TaxID=1031711 RepID=F6G9K5_RALS8|nr:response regulator transcription factor [Ralstonia solanacearum]AEG71919.1 response regulator protein [Ralstonia solanacearum Po82]AMP71780.1 two-component system response regulator [Ralstonia solanacearum]AMP76283.1 two-component system response regulator [Ralstonia solanacearum]EUJ12252.1 hisitidine kinase [Ralstonia solanacearum P673]MBB6588910.1 response regulator transcription factor [Ralstonia solanacearum]
MKFAVLTSSPSSFALIATALASEHVECVRFDDALALLRARRAETFQMLMIDAQQFHTAGQLVLSWRQCNADMRWPTLVFGQFAEREDMLRVFDAGVDDMLVGHFSADELRARVLRLLRHAGQTLPAVSMSLAVGPYRLCRLTHTLKLHGVPIRLTAREFATAWLLFSSPGTFLSRQQIASAVWGTDASVVGRSIEQHIYRLRKKLRCGVETGVEIKTIYARGYQLTIHHADQVQTSRPHPVDLDGHQAVAQPHVQPVQAGGTRTWFLPAHTEWMDAAHLVTAGSGSYLAALAT